MLGCSLSPLQTVLKQKLLNPILQTVFPVLSAAPPPGEEDPEDEENSNEDDTDNESPKHFAAQVNFPSLLLDCIYNAQKTGDVVSESLFEMECIFVCRLLTPWLFTCPLRNYSTNWLVNTLTCFINHLPANQSFQFMLLSSL